MPTATIPIANGADDAIDYRTGPNWPPVLGDTGGFWPLDSGMNATRTYRSWATGLEYIVGQVLFRWDTSVIPDTATVTGASFRFYVEESAAANSGQLGLEWIVHDGSTSIWTLTVVTTAYALTNLSSFPALNEYTIPLTNAIDNINKSGMSGLRAHISTGGVTPTGDNYLRFAALEHASAIPPELIVNYTTYSRTRLAPDGITSQGGFGSPIVLADLQVDPDS